VEPTLEVGLVIKPHGVRGEVVVEPSTHDPGRFEPGSRLISRGTGYTVASSRPQGSRLLVRFEGIEDRNAAEGLRGARLVAAAGDPPPLPAGSYWTHRLIGYRVVTLSGKDLGVLRDVTENPAHDLWVVGEDRKDEISIPAVRELVVSVDEEASLITVRDLPGLTEPG
jgi:16S rRNA processing protein RimM